MHVYRTVQTKTGTGDRLETGRSGEFKYTAVKMILFFLASGRLSQRSKEFLHWFFKLVIVAVPFKATDHRLHER